MKKQTIKIMSVLIIIVLFVLYFIYQNTYHKGVVSIEWYACGPQSPLQFGFRIEKKNDGKLHLVIASKPPQTDIIVTKDQLLNNDLVYTGEGVNVRNSASSTIVSINGTTINDCYRFNPEM